MSLQDLAEQWVAGDDELRDATNKRDYAQREIDAAQRKKDEAGMSLLERVGRNVPVKVFQLGAEVVIVEWERGVKRVAVDSKGP